MKHFLLIAFAALSISVLYGQTPCTNRIDNYDFGLPGTPLLGSFDFGNTNGTEASHVPNWFGTRQTADYVMYPEYINYPNSPSALIASHSNGAQEAIAQDLSTPMPAGNYLLTYSVIVVETSGTTGSGLAVQPAADDILQITFSSPVSLGPPYPDNPPMYDRRLDPIDVTPSNTTRLDRAICLSTTQDWTRIEFRNIYYGGIPQMGIQLQSTLLIDDVKLIYLGEDDYPDIVICPGETPTLAQTECTIDGETYQWSIVSGPGAGTIVGTSATYSLPSTPAATTKYRRTRTVPGGCAPFIDDITVTVETTTISVTPASTYVPSGGSVQLTATGSSSYTWSPATTPQTPTANIVTAMPTTTTTYTATGHCLQTATAVVIVGSQANPCTNGTPGMPLTVPQSGIVTASPTANTFYRVDNSFAVSGTVTITNSVLTIAQNAEIHVLPGALLQIRAGHLHSCQGLWRGIIVHPGGRLEVQPQNILNIINKSSMIEDAVMAIEVKPNSPIISGYILDVRNTVFNRNQIGIAISNYTPSIPNYPFRIETNMFTSRNFTITTTNNDDANLNWRQMALLTVPINTTQPLSNHYLSSTYQYAAPKTTNTPPNAGLQLTNVGTTSLQPNGSATFYGFKVGDAADPTKRNIFDNLQVAVELKSSNFLSGRNVYQVTALEVISYGTAFGIRASGGNGNYRLEARYDEFNNCKEGIYAKDYFETVLQHNTVTTRPGGYAPSAIGFRISTNRYRNLLVNQQNTMINVATGVLISHLAGALNVPNLQNVAMPQTSACYRGTLDVSNNKIQRTAGIPNPAHFVRDAIIVEWVGTPGSIPTVVTPGPQTVLQLNPVITTNGNNLFQVYRGITIRNWSVIVAKSNENPSISLYNAGQQSGDQYGIAHIGVSTNQTSRPYHEIFFNTIFGTNAMNRLNEYAILSAQTGYDHVSCNTVSNSYKGIAFDGATPAITGRILGNTFTNHVNGFVLDHGAVIGPQGSVGHPTGNHWAPGTWTGGHFMTACLSASYASMSKMFVVDVTTDNPNGSSISIPPLPASEYSIANNAIQTTGGVPSFCNSFLIDNPVVDLTVVLEQLVLNGLPGGYFPNETNSILKKEVYSLLSESPDLLISPVLNDFFISQQTTITNQLYTIDRALAQGDYTTAGVLLNSVEPTMPDEVASKRYYVLCRTAFLNDSLLPSDSTLLAELAAACPFTEGRCVYGARTLYDFLYGTSVQFENNCPEYVPGLQKQPMDHKTNTPIFDVGVFPNPSKGGLIHLTTSSEISFNGYTVSIYSSDGQLIDVKMLTLEDAENSVQLPVSAGFYFLHVKNLDSNETIIKKVQVLR